VYGIMESRVKKKNQGASCKSGDTSGDTLRSDHLTIGERAPPPRNTLTLLGEGPSPARGRERAGKVLLDEDLESDEEGRHAG
jgi:hypothetical protein